MTQVLQSGLVVLTILWPLLLLVAWMAVRWRPSVIRLIPTAALPGLLAAIAPLPETVFEIPWLMFGATIGLDEVSSRFLLFSSILWMLGGLLLPDSGRAGYCVWFLVTLAASVTVLLARDIPLFLMAYAIMSLATFGLVLHHRTSRARYAAKVYLAFAVAGEIALFIALLMVAHNSATHELDLVMDRAPGDPLIALLVIGFGIKAGVPLLHMALPLAYSAAPVGAAVPMAGAMFHLGLYGWLRFLPLGVAPLGQWSAAFIYIGMFAVLFGVLAGIAQCRARAVLAYSSMGQTGLMMLVLGVAFAAPGAWNHLQSVLLLFALHHALAKGALFAGLGVRGWSRWGLAIPALALAGVPLTGGAIVKTLVKEQAFLLPESQVFLVELAVVLGTVGTTLLMARFLYLAGREPRSGPVLGPVPWWLLVCASLWLPWLSPVSVDGIGQFPGSVWPVLGGSLLAWTVYRLHARGMLPLVPVIPAGDIVVLVGRLCRLPAGRDAGHGAATPQTKAPGQPAGGPAVVAGAERLLGNWRVATGLLLLILAGLFLSLLYPVIDFF